MKKLLCLLPLSLLALGGCASIVQGTHQDVSIETVPSGASCRLTNDKGTWLVPSTPGTVRIHQSLADMNVDCTRKNTTGNRTVVAHVKGMVFGNLLFGGPIGAVIDVVDGAAYRYPSSMLIPLQTEVAPLHTTEESSADLS